MTTPKQIFVSGAWLLSALWSSSAQGDEALFHEGRARADYMIHCQGCHVGDGSGFKDRVPDLRQSLPLLLSVEGGRAFLVQVPGSSQADLSDKRLADTLTWMVHRFAGDQTLQRFSAFTEAEVAALRPTRLDDVLATRHQLIGHLEENEEMENGRAPE